MRLMTSILLVIAAFTSSPLHGQPRGMGMSSGSRVVSPAVVATWISQYEPPRFTELELLVLWRGTPGWFMRSDGGESTSGSMGPPGQSGGVAGERGPVVHQISFGGLKLVLRFDPQTRSAQIQDREISLSDANVILGRRGRQHRRAESRRDLLGRSTVPGITGWGGDFHPTFAGAFGLPSLRCAPVRPQSAENDGAHLRPDARTMRLIRAQFRPAGLVGDV